MNKNIGQGLSGLGQMMLLTLAMIIELVIGVSILGVTIWAWQHLYLTFNNYALLSITLVLDILMLVIASLGFYGLARRKVTLLKLFKYMVVIFCLGYITLGVVVLVLPGRVLEGECADFRGGAVGRVYAGAQEQLCRGCGCGLTEEAIAAGGYSEDEREGLTGLNRTADGRMKYQQCVDQEDPIYNILQEAQQKLQCSSWCPPPSLTPTTPLLYYFSSVNNGRPLHYCYPAMQAQLHRWSLVLGLCALGSGIAMVLASVLAHAGWLEGRWRGVRGSGFRINSGVQVEE